MHPQKTPTQINVRLYTVEGRGWGWKTGPSKVSYFFVGYLLDDDTNIISHFRSISFSNTSFFFFLSFFFLFFLSFFFFLSFVFSLSLSFLSVPQIILSFFHFTSSISIKLSKFSVIIACKLLHYWEACFSNLWAIATSFF